MSSPVDEVRGPASSRTRRGRPSPLTVLGIVLLAAGLGILGWVGYQYVGTDVISKRHFATDRQDLRDRWAAERPRAEGGPGTGPAPATPGAATALLRIPAFGPRYEIPIHEGTDLGTLARGVGHYAGTARAGAVGNFAIAGHRVTHGEPFSRLLELDQGDQVVVETATAVYTYVLDEAPRGLTVKDTATWVLDPVPGEPTASPSKALITLTTCQDLFHSADRSVGFGHLQSTQNK